MASGSPASPTACATSCAAFLPTPCFGSRSSRATSLDIPGLNGQVANILTASTGTSGQFTWRSGFRAYNTQAQLYGGEISVTGSSGRLDYTVALSNDNDRFGADGPVLITDAAGALIETQETSFSGRFDNPKLSTNFNYDFSDTVTGNLNLAYGEDYFSRRGPEIATPVSGPVRTRDARRGEDGPEYEIGADLEFPFGPGTMKLIGLERFERDNFTVAGRRQFLRQSPLHRITLRTSRAKRASGSAASNMAGTCGTPTGSFRAKRRSTG